jgi:hypothetical protein
MRTDSCCVAIEEPGAAHDNLAVLTAEATADYSTTEVIVIPRAASG